MAISVRWSLIVYGYGLTKAARLGTMIIRITAWCSLALIANTYLHPYLNRRYQASKFEDYCTIPVTVTVTITPGPYIVLLLC
jgi:hypothetical protein